MTKQYALLKLLEHGALTASEARIITGWSGKQVTKTIQHLLEKGLVERISSYPHRYDLA